MYQVSNSTCFQLDNNTIIEGSSSDSDYHFGSASAAELQEFPSNCTKGELRRANNGLSFQVNCNTDNPGFDLCPNTDPVCRWHAETLDECLNHCSANHPLCAGVVWDFNMSGGWDNCYPKLPNSPLSNLIYSPQGIWAPAQITNLTDQCPSKRQYTTAANLTFDLTCDVLPLGRNYSARHFDNVHSCMDYCASETSKGNSRHCIAAAFDTYMNNGYENCYLMNETDGVNSSSVGFILGAVQKSTTSNTTSETTSGGRRPSNNKAWIAGPVIGAIALITLLAALAYWWRRRRRATMSKAAELDSDASPSGSHQYEKPPLTEHPSQELDESTKRYESDSVPVSELPGSIGQFPQRQSEH
ncbi:hypothetical protein NA57DRAFT_78490 [Rhizodiscina lignyota]|uniref:Apple domain-containing protein n=1 Tax=Rhizodiscina lignyota TaxID=1504668 RepID=A0A9P4ICT2_9PEZI|nr:hypothetical protein NA57DRAFT_78490 [Rhizodiscina lignyota]